MRYIYQTTDANNQPYTFELNGRKAWALNELIQAGKVGCTLLDNPAPRWSGYIHNLRHDYGLEIVTIHEPHTGPFPGTHARYILNSIVFIVPDTSTTA